MLCSVPPLIVFAPGALLRSPPLSMFFMRGNTFPASLRPVIMSHVGAFVKDFQDRSSK